MGSFTTPRAMYARSVRISGTNILDRTIYNGKMSHWVFFSMTFLLTSVGMSVYTIRTRAEMTQSYALFLRGGPKVAVVVGGGGALPRLRVSLLF